MSKGTKKYVKSAFAEFNYLSIGIIIAICAFILACLIFFGMMFISPKKTVTIKDDADIFTADELDEIEEIATKLMKRDNINVVIVTTRNKNKTLKNGYHYSNSDSDCAEFAGDYYANKAISTQFRDNSGICILVDLTLDYDGGRFFWLYTYGRTYYAISNDDANAIFRRYKSDLQAGEYGEAISEVLTDVSKYDFDNLGVFFMSNVWLLLAIPLAFLGTFMFTHKKKLDPVPPSKEYRIQREFDINEDRYIRQTVSVTTVSSSSGGGGGGGFSGGGGGGHSGGGGGRF